MSNVSANDPDRVEARAAVVELVIEGRPRDVGTMVVSRILPAARRRMVGPFVFLDHMGPVELAPGVGFDVLPHPHIGLSTVTYFLAGENVHRDSLGTVQVNRPHDVNIMTAGKGVVHSERADPVFREAGGSMHGVQIWLALPDAHEDDEPSFEHHPAATLPEILGGAVRGRVLIGSAFGATSPIRHPSAPLLVDLELDASAELELPADTIERAVFVIEGELELAGETRAANHLAVLVPGATVHLRAVAPSRVMLIGGVPIGPRLIEWNFVASTRARLDAARDAWRAQEFPKIPTDADEYVPFPSR